MIKKTLHTPLACCLSASFCGQWQQSTGAAGLNIQSNGIYNFARRQTGVYVSTDNAASYSLSNSSNDFFGPTRCLTKDNNYIFSSSSLSTIDLGCIASINDTLFDGTNGLGIYKSVDWGVNWVAVNSGLGVSKIIEFITFLDMDYNNFFAGIRNLYRFSQGLTNVYIHNKNISSLFVYPTRK